MKQLIRSAFMQYLDDGRKDDWNDAIDAVKKDLMSLRKDKEDKDEA